MPFHHPVGASPQKIFLFSGHMIDAATRAYPRFPPDKVPIAAAEISKTLDQMHAGHADLAICGGACGGDLLFAEAALARNLTLELYIPFRDEEFLAKSVDFADADWRSRFFAVKSRASLHVAPNELGPIAMGEDPYGEGGDGPGGTQHHGVHSHRAISTSVAAKPRQA